MKRACFAVCRLNSFPGLVELNEYYITNSKAVFLAIVLLRLCMEGSVETRNEACLVEF